MSNMKLQAALIAAFMAGSMASAYAQQGDGKVRSNGLGLISADGENSINLTGRIHVDM